MPTTEITRTRYMRNEITFHDYYGALVELLGERALRSLLPLKRDSAESFDTLGAHTPAEWRELLKTDQHLNNVPLGRWDAQDYAVRSRVRQNLDAVEAISGSRAWSLSDTVCVLKETARRYAASEGER